MAVRIQIRIREERGIRLGLEQFLLPFADDAAATVGIDDHDFQVRHARAEQRDHFPDVTMPERVPARPGNELRFVGLGIAVVDDDEAVVV